METGADLLMEYMSWSVSHQARASEGENATDFGKTAIVPMVFDASLVIRQFNGIPKLR
jgi:hypothetical protein